ncbi:MAG: hypothetical protein HDS72_08815 [Bacteroidales bacterium]|nr:hypothetical protein [Bacteroidales bacterium]
MSRRPIIVRSRLMPPGICLNLFGTFWARDTSWIDKYVVNHERIHTAQQRELLFVPFYILYVLEWLVRLVQERNLHRAYMRISFEREAYTHGNDLSYLAGRRHYAWRRWLRNGKC